MIIKSNHIYLENQVFSGYLFVEHGKIKDVAKTYDGHDFLDYSNQMVIPGIFDTHNHGYMGYSLKKNENQTDEDVEYNVRGYLKALPSTGITSILPTAQIETFKVIADIVGKGYTGAHIVGIHSEGPYLNRVGEKGRARKHPDVDVDYVKKAIQEANGLLKLMDVAPEIENIDLIIDLLKENQIKIGYAHSNLGYEEAKQAIAKGIRVATHLSNVMTGLHHRDIGGCGALLMDPDVDCELICDGLHVSLPYIEILFKAKDYSKFMMISDSSNLAGLKPGEYKGFYQDVHLYVDEEGFIKDSDGRISGSSKPVIYGMRNLVQKLHIPLETVIKMASLNPANVYGVGDTKGSLKIEKDADFVCIDQDFNVLLTVCEGEVIFDARKDHIVFNPKFDGFR